MPITIDKTEHIRRLKNDLVKPIRELAAANAKFAAHEREIEIVCENLQDEIDAINKQIYKLEKNNHRALRFFAYRGATLFRLRPSMAEIRRWSPLAHRFNWIIKCQHQ